MSPKQETEKETTILPQNGILLNNKWEQISDTCSNMDKSQMQYVK